VATPPVAAHIGEELLGPAPSRSKPANANAKRRHRSKRKIAKAKSVAAVDSSLRSRFIAARTVAANLQSSNDKLTQERDALQAKVDQLSSALAQAAKENAQSQADLAELRTEGPAKLQSLLELNHDQYALTALATKNRHQEQLAQHCIVAKLHLTDIERLRKERNQTRELLGEARRRLAELEAAAKPPLPRLLFPTRFD
jgi:chromosome segregation ATPase